MGALSVDELSNNVLMRDLYMFLYIWLLMGVKAILVKNHKTGKSKSSPTISV